MSLVVTKAELRSLVRANESLDYVRAQIKKDDLKSSFCFFSNHFPDQTAYVESFG